MRHLKIINQRGFTSVELIIACIIFPLVAIGITGTFDAIRKSYTTAKQLNEVYAVLSACPEIDRALDYTTLTGTNNCFPNNTFTAEGGSGITYSYAPTLTVSDTSALDATDALKSVPDSKVVNITVALPHSTAPALQLRMLITRNGIAQQ